MPVIVRFIWGMLSGVAVVLVKAIGPDMTVIKEFFLTGNGGEFAFYIFVSGVTIMLGGLSGLFARERDPLRVLAFCAAFPALVTTYTSPPRLGPDANKHQTIEEVTQQKAAYSSFNFITSVQAQDLSNTSLVCDEGTFSEQFAQAAKTYFKNEYPSDSFAVVVGSEKDFEVAKQKANTYTRQSKKYAINVGCRRSGNPYFPIMVGNSTDYETALVIKGEVIGEGWAPSDTYLSNYPYRKIIYESRKP